MVLLLIWPQIFEKSLIKFIYQWKIRSDPVITSDPVRSGDYTHPLVNVIYGWAYLHDGRADKDSYPHDCRADNAPYRHDRRADKNPYRHDRNVRFSS